MKNNIAGNGKKKDAKIENKPGAVANAQIASGQAAIEKKDAKAEQKPPQLTPEQIKANEEMTAKAKEIENTLFALKFYPVAVKEQAKNDSIKKLETMYATENETIRQLMLYMIHESITAATDFKIAHSFDYFKSKAPNGDPAQHRMNVYRAMFNYNTSIEGVAEILGLLGRFRGSDDAIKLLTYHFSHLCSYESEANQILRGVILDTLGNSESKYALDALLTYAKYVDNERTFNRIVDALQKWESRLDNLKLADAEKDAIRSRLKEVSSRDFNKSHYG